MSEIVIYVIVPYICLAAVFIGFIINLKTSSLRISAPATGFLEKEKLSVGSASWHYGIVFVLLGHVIGLLFPGTVLNIISNNGTKLFLEILALGLGFSALFGLIVLLVRRVTADTVSYNTKTADILILVLLLAQVLLGIIVAINYRWGIAWYASNFSKFIYSLILLNPKTGLVVGMPLLVGLHFVLGFMILGVLPYTKLIHFVFIPFGYFFRKPQIVIYNK